MTEHGKAPGSSEAEQMAWRRGKLEGLRSQGWDFPNDFKRSCDADGTEHTAALLQARYGDWEKAALEAEGLRVTLAGRLMNRRGPFMVLQEGSGSIQFYLAKSAEDGLRDTVAQWDIGDIVAGTGTLEKSGKGDLYLNLTEARLLTKALRPLPDQYYGIADTELRYRRRYLDLIMNEASRETFRVRSQVVSAVRRFLEERRFMEVETPMMHVIPGGAAAKPFVTHHNALDMPLFLRIAPELYLKRLTVGGFERVFEINRNFRNEGLSTKHRAGVRPRSARRFAACWCTRPLSQGIVCVHDGALVAGRSPSHPRRNRNFGRGVRRSVGANGLAFQRAGA